MCAPEDEGLPQLDLFPLRLRRGLDPVWWGVGRVRRAGRRRWVGEARREEASWDRGWRAFGSGRAHAMGAC